MDWSFWKLIWLGPTGIVFEGLSLLQIQERLDTEFALPYAKPTLEAFALFNGRMAKLSSTASPYGGKSEAQAGSWVGF